LLSSFDGKFGGAREDVLGVAGDVTSGVGFGVGEGVGDTVPPMDHLDPSRLPLAQRQLFMRIQQKQHRDEINNKPISELTAKRERVFSSGFLPARRYASAVFATATCPSVTRRYCA